MTLLTMLWAATALADGPATPDPSCVGASGAAAEACRCVFESDATDWANEGAALKIDGTCFDFIAHVNPIGTANRATALQRMTTVGRYYACYSDREFTRLASWSAGVPTVFHQQLLESMDEEECAMGGDIAVQREAEFDGDTWMVSDGQGSALAWIKTMKDVQLVWQLDDNEDEEDDLVIYFADKTIWIAYSIAEGDTVEAPEE